MPHAITCTDKDYNFDTYGVMKQGEVGRVGQEGKGWKWTHLPYIGSVQNILATIVQCSAELN
jgi:hypothetical protein